MGLGLGGSDIYCWGMEVKIGFIGLGSKFGTQVPNIRFNEAE